MTSLKIIRAKDSFESLDKEKGSHDRSSLVSSNESIKRLSEGLEKVLALEDQDLLRTEEAYDFGSRIIYNVCSVIAPEKYRAKDIEAFTVSLSQGAKGQNDEVFGMYLSWLMNNSPDSSFRLNMRALDRVISCIGYSNRGKSIEVLGDVGDDCGAWMYSGRITVQGSVGRWAGSFMQGGILEIEGNVYDNLAKAMEGGIITVRGNCGSQTGDGMHGGEVYLEGDVENLGSVHGTAKIFHKGALVRQGDNKCPF